MKNLFSTWRQDLPAGLVVFLVALPLCLGVALASTGDKSFLFSGIISGVVGGIVVGLLSGSSIGVSGPAAGLITIVASAITTLGSFDAFLVSVVLAGAIQLICGFLGAGVIGSYFPSSVIKGMLAAIGITLILKEIPHAFGYDADFMGDEAFFQIDGENTFSEIFMALNKTNPGAIIISVISILILILFQGVFFNKLLLFKLLPAALFVVIIGIAINQLFKNYLPDFYLNTKHLVELPKAKNWSDFQSFFRFPNFSALSNYKVYVIALTIALIGSIETLLSVEATDKLDPEGGKTPTNKELKAQGLGNILAGFLGGLPITQVIVRSSANVSAGGKSKLSAIFHGLLLFVAVIFLPQILNLIPLASLAGILIMIGYKLTNIKLFKGIFKLGLNQFFPFIVTTISILLTDLLVGIAIGILVSLLMAVYGKSKKFDGYQEAITYFFVFFIKRNFRKRIHLEKGDNVYIIVFKKRITFLNKVKLMQIFDSIPPDAKITLDGTECEKIDHDIMELIHKIKSKNKKIEFINITI